MTAARRFGGHKTRVARAGLTRETEISKNPANHNDDNNNDDNSSNNNKNNNNNERCNDRTSVASPSNFVFFLFY